jgi:tetratricopeptide (TPR) repeat protein
MIRLIVCLLLVGAVSGFADEADVPEAGIPGEYYSADNILEFADYLYQNKDYLRAAGEYQRYLFMNPSAENSDAIFYRMIKAVFLGRDYPRCGPLLDNFENKYEPSQSIYDIALYRAIVSYRMGNYLQSLRIIQEQQRPESSPKQILMAMDYLYLGEIEKARQRACDPKPDEENRLAHNDPGDYNSALPHLCDRISGYDALGRKNAFRAGLYSSVVPGLGKVYCGRTADGVYALVIIGLTAWQAYDGFADDGNKSVKGWVFGTLGAGFYLGNIYGSVIAARLYNDRIRNEFIRGLNIEINLP